MMARVYEEARLCHGIVLNENTVVAPATCVNNVPVEAVGFERNSFESFTDNSIAITNVELHPQFDSSAIQNEHPLENNIALLRLVNPINFRESAEIQPACLAQLDSKRVHPQPVLLASGLGNNWPDRSYHNALELHSNGAGARSQQREYKRVGFTQSQILRAASIQSSSPLCTRDIGTPLHLLVNGNNGKHFLV